MPSPIAVRCIAAAIVALPTAGCPAPSPVHRLPIPAGLDLSVPLPPDRPPTAAGAELGRRLFFDPILSKDRNLSCASCHRPELAFADSTARSAGLAGVPARRNTPGLINVSYRPHLSWIGRTTTLEEQVLLPILDSLELGIDLGELDARLRADASYRAAFRRAFGGPPSPSNVAQALAGYLRTLLSADSPYDRFLAGDTTALSVEARRGLRLFTGRAGCSACHIGPNLSDGRFHNTGVAVRSGDRGRMAVTGREADRGAFQTPSLRNVELTGPYMHDGRTRSLEAVIEFYAGGGIANPQLDADLRPRQLSSQDRADLAMFLRALTSRTLPGT
jgi:cytochrome c peroxidase